MPALKGQKRDAVWEYSLIILGSAIASFGIYNVHRQSGVTEGGVIGLVLLLDHWLGISPAISTPILDGVCYLIGFSLLGRKFLKNSIIATISISIFYSIYEYFGPILPSFANQPLIAAVLGGIFVGVGVGLVVRAGAAMGGDDALALVLSHRFKIRIARAYLFSDWAVLLISLSYIPLGRIVYSLVTVTISSLLVGYVEGGSNGRGHCKIAES